MAERVRSFSRKSAYADPYLYSRTKVPFMRKVCDYSKATIFRRTLVGWTRLLLFYVCFYSALTIFFWLHMKALLYFVILPTEPRLKLLDSSIGTSPGVDYRPKHPENYFLNFERRNSEQISDWENYFDVFLSVYRSMSENQVVCDFNTILEEHQVCIQNVSAWQSCYSNQTYGYADTQPCFLIKLNRIYNWKPEFYDDITDLPKNMPNELVQHIVALKPEQRKQVWVSCASKSTGFAGEIEYVSEWRGFPGYFYPYHKQSNYLSPLVAVRVISPPINTVVKLECRVWAKNIGYKRSQREPKGAQNIEFRVDDNKKKIKILEH